jgi:prepilin-type N-terminal cleavage/methylation domain-containing protein
VRPRRGFTLVEVLVALVVTAVLALLSHQLAAAVGDHAARLRDARRALDRRSNAYGMLRSALLSLEVGLDSAPEFLGHADRVRFAAWVPAAEGWSERRTLALQLEGDRWTASAPPDEHVVLAGGITEVRLDYLLEPGAGATWVRQWESAVSAPLAVRVRLTRKMGPVDTLLFLVKSRG